MKYKRTLSFVILGFVAGWLTKAQLTSIILPGKDFFSRSVFTQGILVAAYSVVFAGLIFLIVQLTVKYLLPLLVSLINKDYFIHARLLFKKLTYLLYLMPILIWAFVFYCVPRGFDITDNGYYLLNSARFEDVSYEIRLFGIFTRLLYFAAGGSTGIMRILGAVLLLIMSLLSGWFAGKHFNAKSLDQKLFFLLSPSIPAAMFYYDWLSTPNYNWLALVAGLCLTTGFLGYFGTSRHSAVIGGFTLCVSCFIAFFAKPTTSALFFAISLAVVFIERKKKSSIKPVIWGALTGLAVGVVFIYVSGLTIPGLIEKIIRGNYAISLFAHSISSIFMPLINYAGNVTIDLAVDWAVILSVFAFVYIFIDVKPETKNLIYVSLWLFFLLLPGLLFDAGIWVGFGLILTFLVILLTTLLFHRDININIDHPGVLFRKALYLLFVALAIAFGTINNYTYYFAHILCIFVLSGIFLIELLPDYTKGLARGGYFLVLAILVTYNMFILPNQSSTVTAYRQDVNTWDMKSETSIRSGKERIIFSANYASVFTDLQNQAETSGFRTETPVIDLSGMSPGIIYILDGRSPVYPWMAGGYANSTQFARSILSEWKEEDIQQAWILTSKIFTSLPESLLVEKGLDFPGSYQEVATITLPIASYRDFPTITLWKPVR